ncbi:hypothetical protein KFE25_013293 [Diacronema lutheri]|uniref:Glutamine amidotransferase domain-containing protein n=1 Tax=Diacronema lutheri TaxID=2081491 RepID=A0A8J5XUJ4_DIALT|nr:hypothetical protein KFE25_013293 [Diacronema lutheri]
MRSLLVVCTPDGAPDGRAAQLGQGLAVFVRELFAGMTANYARVEIDVRSHTQLDDLTPARDVPISREQPAQFDKVKRLDMIDLVFVYATADFAPWADAAQPARWFVRNCLLARKCVLAWGGGMQLVAYVLGTGGDISATPVRSVDGAPLSTMMPPGSRLPAGRLALDAHTGELLQWNPSSRSWLALPATCGSHLHSGHPDAPFRRVDERGSTVRDLHFARSADCRQISANVHAQAVRHPLIRGAIAARAQLEVRNAWSCHLRARGSFGRLGELRTLLVHPHGVQAFEVGNCVALQCELSAHYAAGPALARRFCERALALLALLREGEMRGTLAPHAPLPLAYIVGQRTIDGIPSAMLDTVALLAPESDTARIAFRTQRGMLTERGAGPAEDARSPRAASETKRWSARQELHSITPPTRPAPAASGARPRPSSARTRTVADTASPASPAPPARVALGGPSPLRTRPASAHVRGSSAAAHATTLVAIAGGPHDRPSTARNVRPGAGERAAAAPTFWGSAPGGVASGVAFGSPGAYARARHASAGPSAREVARAGTERSAGETTVSGRLTATAQTLAWAGSADTHPDAGLAAASQWRVTLQPHGAVAPFTAYRAHQARAAKPHERDVHSPADESRRREERERLLASRSLHGVPFRPSSPHATASSAASLRSRV